MRMISAILPMLWLVAQAAGAAEPVAGQQVATTSAGSAAGQGGYESSGAQASAVPANSVASDEFLNQATLRLEQQGTLTAKVRLQAELFGQQLFGTGTYAQQAGEGASQYASRQPDSIVGIRMKLELRIVRGAEPAGDLLNVCDGRNLWMYQVLGDQSKLSRIDVWKVRDALERVGPSRASPTTLLTLGGLPKLVAGLRNSFQYTEPRQGELNGHRVIVLDGVLKPAPLALLLPEQKEAIDAGKPADLTKLPRQAPAAVQVVLGAEDLFPYRIEYRKPSSKKNKHGDSTEADAWQSLMVLELFEMQRNIQLGDGAFDYQPSGIEVADQTEAFLKGLK